MPEPIKPVRIVYIDGREYHQMGDYVCLSREVVRSTKPRKLVVDGIEYIGPPEVIYTPRGEFTIGFDGIREHPRKPDEYYVDEDNPTDGGLTAEAAAQVRNELTRAIDYLAQLRKGTHEQS